jgi:photosystem II stability/assembly factor-like uncharacterized protein
LSRRDGKWAKIWAFLGAGLLIVAASVGSVRGAIESGVPSWLGLFGVAIKPNGGIFIVGAKSLLMVSTDHGKTWIQQILKERAGTILFQDRDLYSVRFAQDGKSGWIVGEVGTVLHTGDGGHTWTTQQSGVGKSLFKVYAIDDQTAVTVGADGAIIRTADGGAHWQEVKFPKEITLFDVTFTDKDTGWIAGEFSTVLGSRDGGQSWNVVYGGNTGDFTIGPFFTVTFIDSQNGMVAGLAGDIMVTSDGGRSWTPQKLPDEVGSYIATSDPSNKKLWIGGTCGRMFAQSSGGQWKEVRRVTFHDLTDIAFAGDQGVAVGLNGTILLSQNAGEQWQAVQ